MFWMLGLELHILHVMLSFLQGKANMIVVGLMDSEMSLKEIGETRPKSHDQQVTEGGFKPWSPLWPKPCFPPCQAAPYRWLRVTAEMGSITLLAPRAVLSPSKLGALRAKGDSGVGACSFNTDT